MSTVGTRNEAVPPEVNLHDAVVWSDKATELKDFASHNALPGLALIVKGRYRSVGSAAATASAASGTTSGTSDGGKLYGTNGTCSNVVFVQSINEAHKVRIESCIYVLYLFQ